MQGSFEEVPQQIVQRWSCFPSCCAVGFLAFVAVALGLTAVSSDLMHRGARRTPEHIPVYSRSGVKIGVWILHQSLSCEPGWGAQQPPLDAPDTSDWNQEKSRAICESMDGCDGLVCSRASGDSRCDLRWMVDTERCVKDNGVDFWHLWRFQTPDFEPAGMDGLPAETFQAGANAQDSETGLPGEPKDQPNIVFDDGLVQQITHNRAPTDDGLVEQITDNRAPTDDGLVEQITDNHAPTDQDSSSGTTTEPPATTAAAPTQMDTTAAAAKMDTTAAAATIATTATTTTTATITASAREAEWMLHRGMSCSKATPHAKKLDGDVSLMQCREACVEAPDCEAIQTDSGRIFGSCLLQGAVDISKCDEDVAYDLWKQVEVGHGNLWGFRPVDGGDDRECRGRSSVDGHDSEDDYVLHSGASLEDCKGFCRASTRCRGIQHQPETQKCQVWTRAVGGSKAGKGSMCLEYASAGGLPQMGPMETTSVTVTSTCPSCAPKKPVRPAIVVPTFERDLCKMKLTVKSISVHDPLKLLGDLHVLWVTDKPLSDYQAEFDEMKSSIGETHAMHVHDYSGYMNGKDGWFAQQLFKLKVASEIKDDYYIVLDSKNTFIRDVQEDTFFSACNQALVFSQYEWDQVPEPHDEWYVDSAKVLELDLESVRYDYKWPASVTPMTMHRQTVMGMLEAMGEDPSPENICGGPLCGMLDDGATEFTTYVLYSRLVAQHECIHQVVTPKLDEDVAISLWRGYDGSFDQLQMVASKELRPTMFGSQAGALDGMDYEKTEQVPKLVQQIFTSAGLAESQEVLMECVVGMQRRRVLRLLQKKSTTSQKSTTD